MAHLHYLYIENFRGIKKFSNTFGPENYCVLIGRGDSGKSTILKAISYLLNPSWNLNITDFDFHNMDVQNSIQIEGVFTDIPDEIASFEKFGQYIQVIDANGNISSNIEDVDGIPCLKIRLIVDDSLEPKWHIVSDREIGNKEISSRDREKFKMFSVSDYIDSQFSLSKGSPLARLLTISSKQSIQSLRKIFAELSREAYKIVSQTEKLDNIKEHVSILKSKANTFGLRLEDLVALIEFSGNSYSESNISIHHNNIPARLLGKGSKRLLSIALQMELISEGGIVLIDEVEQGLESDRIRHLVKHLFRTAKGQVFLTTHSNDVLVEAKCNQVFLMKNGATSLRSFDSSKQGVLRKHPKAFYGLRVVSCEGATEEGVVRALGDYLLVHTDLGIEGRDVVPIDAGGSNEFYKMAKSFSECDFDVAVFCDSDLEEKLADDKAEVVALNIPIVQCEIGFALEQQIFNHIPWDGVLELLVWAEENNDKSIFPISGTRLYSIEEIANLPEKDRDEARKMIGAAAKSKQAWYKSINGGEALGNVIMRNFENMNEENPLKKEISELLKWLEHK